MLHALRGRLNQHGGRVPLLLLVSFPLPPVRLVEQAGDDVVADGFGIVFQVLQHRGLELSPVLRYRA